jgi:hypothetical protein
VDVQTVASYSVKSPSIESIHKIDFNLVTWIKYSRWNGMFQKGYFVRFLWYNMFTLVQMVGNVTYLRNQVDGG